MIRVLFVCMGNICRSPMAQGVLEQRLNEEQLEDRVQVDSAGTHHYHSGDPPDRRGVTEMRRALRSGGRAGFSVWCEIESCELFVDFFDTAGTLTSIANVAGKIGYDGKVDGIGRAVISDSVATVAGALSRRVRKIDPAEAEGQA